MIKSESWTGKITHTLKGGGTEKEGGETNILRGVSWVKGWVLKKEGSWNPLTNYEFLFDIIFCGQDLWPNCCIKHVSWYQQSTTSKVCNVIRWKQLQRLSCPVQSKKLSKLYSQRVNKFSDVLEIVSHSLAVRAVKVSLLRILIFKPLAIFERGSILNVWQGSKSTSV